MKKRYNFLKSTSLELVKGDKKVCKRQKGLKTIMLRAKQILMTTLAGATMASGFASNMAPAFAEDSTQPVTASKTTVAASTKAKLTTAITDAPVYDDFFRTYI